jgi:predicted DNA-binding transcriptional regulator AlpA
MNNKETPQFLKLEDVSKITQLGKSTILAWEAQGRFPLAVRLSPTFRVWLEADVYAWMMSKREESIQQAKEVSHE